MCLLTQPPDHEVARRQGISAIGPAATHQHAHVGVEGEVDCPDQKLVLANLRQLSLDDLEVIGAGQANRLAPKQNLRIHHHFCSTPPQSVAGGAAQT